MGTKLKDYLETSARTSADEALSRRAVFAESYSIAAQLMVLRVKRNLTQAQLGALTGIAQSEISRIERGVVRPTDTTLVRLADALGADVRIVERPANKAKRAATAREAAAKRTFARV